jgi:hypothetical protein
MGSSLYRPVVKSSGARRGRPVDRAWEGHSARRRHLSTAGEPLLANLFLHYAFDRWMRSRYPQLPFERYADDAIVHCRTEAEAQEVRTAIAARMEECRLELHPVKTKIVYCRDDDRRRRYPNEKFDFLGYGFQPRRSKNRFGKYFINFSPAISDEAGKSIRDGDSKLESAFGRCPAPPAMTHGCGSRRSGSPAAGLSGPGLLRSLFHLLTL